MVGDENGRSRTDMDSDDRTMFGMESFENRFKVGEWFSEQLNFCDDGDVWRAGREGYRGCEGGEDGSDKEDDAKSNEDDEPCFHYVKVWCNVTLLWGRICV